MDTQLKRKLLSRKFSSIEYAQEMRELLTTSLEGLKESIAWFYKHPPEENWENWHVSDRPDGWEERAIRNFEQLLNSVDKGIEHYQVGDSNRLRGTANNIMSLSRDMDVLGEKWWNYVDSNVAKKFGTNLRGAEQMASNIWRTIGEYWKTEDSILNESITGPIDEHDLMKYLDKNEKAPLT